MSIILTNLRNAVIAGIVLTVIMVVIVCPPRRDVFAGSRMERLFHPLAACPERRHVRPAVVLNFVNPQYAEYHRRAETGDFQSDRAGSAVWFRWAAMAR